MKLNLSRIVTVSAVVAAFGLGGSQARAQKATFNLPFESRWGNIVLAPGNYTLTTPSSSSATRIFYLHGDAGTQLTVPRIVSREPSTGRTYLKLVNVEGTYYVEEYASGTAGTALKFALPKGNHRNLTAQQRVLVAPKF